MLTPRGNIHHSALPRPGALVTLSARLSSRLRTHRVRWRMHRASDGKGYRFERVVARKWIVEAFNVCDSADWRYSRGIHLVHLRALDNAERVTVAGHWCEEWDA